MKRTINFKSQDNLDITADIYTAESSKGLILLCHQARYSRGEYIDTASKLNDEGYSCMAIDQRSGGEVKGVINETNKRAKEQGLPTEYTDAKQDILSAIDYCYKLNGDKPVILVGSSYSASLSLLIASEENNFVKAVVAFSPGEYLAGIDLTEKLFNIQIPTLALSSKDESEDVRKLLSNANLELIGQFIPSVQGVHGSSALWPETQGNQEYWNSFLEFLQNLSSE